LVDYESDDFAPLSDRAKDIDDFEPSTRHMFDLCSDSEGSSVVRNDDPSGPVIMRLARIAVYDDLLSSPRIVDIQPAPLLRFIETIATETYERARVLGGRIPYTAIREIAENFIHADFRECTVSILDGGNTIRFSDHGPGIEKKLLVLQPGVTSASETMRRYIKGVGSGFPIVREYLEINQGSLRIDDNAVEGTVVTISLVAVGADIAPAPATSALTQTTRLPDSSPSGLPVSDLLPASDHYPPPPDDSLLQQQLTLQTLVGVVDPRARAALEIIAELGAAGPTDLVGPLKISAATGTRLLDRLEAAGFIEKTSNRKRILSNTGLAFLQRSSGY